MLLAQAAISLSLSAIRLSVCNLAKGDHDLNCREGSLCPTWPSFRTEEMGLDALHSLVEEPVSLNHILIENLWRALCASRGRRRSRDLGAGRPVSGGKKYRHQAALHPLHVQSPDFAAFLNEEETESLLMKSYSETIEAGAVILAEGDTAAFVDIIWTGVVETNVTDERGGKRPLEPLSAGEYCGLASMLMDAPSFQTFMASTDVTLLRIDRKCFKELAANREEC